MRERSRLLLQLGSTTMWDTAKQKTRLRAQKNNKGFRWALDWLINMPQGLHSARSLSDSPYSPNPSPANKHKPNQAYTRWGWKAAQGASSVDLEDVMTQDGDFFICLFWYKVVWCNSAASCSRASRADTSLKGFSTMFLCTCFFCFTWGVCDRDLTSSCCFFISIRQKHFSAAKAYKPQVPLIGHWLLSRDRGRAVLLMTSLWKHELMKQSMMQPLLSASTPEETKGRNNIFGPTLSVSGSME